MNTNEISYGFTNRTRHSAGKAERKVVRVMLFHLYICGFAEKAAAGTEMAASRNCNILELSNLLSTHQFSHSSL